MTRNTFILKIQRELSHPKRFGSFEKRAPDFERKRTVSHRNPALIQHSCSSSYLMIHLLQNLSSVIRSLKEKKNRIQAVERDSDTQVGYFSRLSATTQVAFRDDHSASLKNSSSQLTKTEGMFL